MAKKKKKSDLSLYIKLVAIIFILGIVATLFYIFVLLKPMNNRVWEYGFEILPTIKQQGNQLTINNIRDNHYAPGKIVSSGYLNRTVDLTTLQRAWFVVEPFPIQPLARFNIIAHTYFVFDFKDQKPIVVSVEARREKGETYNAWIGMFNKYELMYVWATEEDVTARRVVIEHNKLYMYPLQITQAAAQQLFLQMADSMHELETTPRFYNSLTSNCTNELAKNANRVKPNAIPFTIALFLPGYATQELYKLGFIPHDKPLDQIKQEYYISDYVQQFYDKPDFSEQLRSHLSR